MATRFSQCCASTAFLAPWAGRCVSGGRDSLRFVVALGPVSLTLFVLLGQVATPFAAALIYWPPKDVQSVEHGRMRTKNVFNEKQCANNGKEQLVSITVRFGLKFVKLIEFFGIELHANGAKNNGIFGEKNDRTRLLV